MTRPTDWHVLDMDGDPTPGDPVRVRQLASRFHDFAETANRARLAVESLQGDGALLAWVGKSGDAFREQFGDFPHQVNKLYRSHLMTGDALDAFAPSLERAQAQADRALADGRVAAEKVASLKGALSVAEADFTGAAKAAEAAQAETVKPDPDQVKAAVRDASAAQARRDAAQNQVSGAQSELDLAKQLAMQAKQVRDDASNTCVRQIEDASDAGIQPRNFWQKLGDAFKEIWNIICEVAQWVALVAGIIGMILGGPLAWIALAAGAILLIKAIVDFSQGKGSVMDLVFGILGVIPGVKGLTSVSKLSALYKAGGMKEIGKAALNGMRNMAKNMVNIVKAAGSGAVTIVKALGDGSAAALAGLKNVNRVVTGAIDTGRVGDYIPAGLPKAGAPPTKIDFGMPAPHTPGAGGAAPKPFAQQFQDLSALKVQHEQTKFAQINSHYNGLLKADTAGYQQKFTQDLKIEVGKIDADHAAKLAAGTQNIENGFQNALKLEVGRINADSAANLNIRKTEINADFASQRQVKIDELKVAADTRFAADKLNLENVANARNVEIDNELAGLRNQAGQVNQHIATLDPAAEAAFRATYKADMDRVDADFHRLTAEQNALPGNLANDVKALEANALKTFDADRATAINDLDIKNADALALADKQFADAAKIDIENTTKTFEAQRDLDVANLTGQLDAARQADIATVTGKLENIRDTDIQNATNHYQQLAQNDIGSAQSTLDTWFDTNHAGLNNHMLDTVSETVKVPNGADVKVLHLQSGADPADLGTVVDKNLPKLDHINPMKDPSDVNCTICVQRVNDYIKNDTISIAPKIPSPQPLSEIIKNHPGMVFQQIPNADYKLVIQDMAAQPPGTVGVIGIRGPNIPGHVMNVVNVDGRVAFVDGQTGKLGYLPNLNGGELHYAPFP